MLAVFISFLLPSLILHIKLPSSKKKKKKKKKKKNSMYIELPSHSLLQGGPFFFADFCDRVKIKNC